MEVELKFQVPAARRHAVLALVRGRAAAVPRRVRLQAAYFDTPDRLLAQAGMALRLRREGRRWVQTLKGLGEDGLSREEHNLPLSAAEVQPGASMADPQRHAGVPVGARLLALLAGQPPQALACTYRTDIWRLTRPLQGRLGRVELAFDEGWLLAGDARLPVCELEIELLEGHPLAVVEAARRWALRHGLWLDSRSKAERGDMLSRGVAVAAPRRAVDARLERGQTPRQALQAVIRACRDQVVANAAQVAADEFDAEHVHQLRVGLRRLRSGLQLFAEDPEAAALAEPLSEPAAQLFRRLGAARDAAVQEGEVGTALQAALSEVDVAARLPVPAPSAAAEAPARVLRDSPSQSLLLDLIAAGLPAAPVASAGRGGSASHAAAPVRDHAQLPPSAQPKRLRSVLARRLNRWHRAILKDAATFATLDVAARHRLRKRIKRLRYAFEFLLPLYAPKPARRLRSALAAAGEALGELNDLYVAGAAYEALLDDEPRAWFALGWLAAERARAAAASAAALRALASTARPWPTKKTDKTDKGAKGAKVAKEAKEAKDAARARR
jgi:inorganic triphosphatase YgiF